VLLWKESLLCGFRRPEFGQRAVCEFEAESLEVKPTFSIMALTPILHSPSATIQRYRMHYF
jgi:hypothetical protein